MKSWIVAYLAAGIAFLAVDAVWLSVMAKRLYQPALGDLMAPSFRLLPAGLFYLIYVAGIVVLTVIPAMRWQSATLFGAALGFVAYATYDLTNQATLVRWSPLLTVADMAWGTIATAFAATVGYAVVNLVFNSAA